MNSADIGGSTNDANLRVKVEAPLVLSKNRMTQVWGTDMKYNPESKGATTFEVFDFPPEGSGWQWVWLHPPLTIFCGTRITTYVE